MDATICLKSLLIALTMCLAPARLSGQDFGPVDVTDAPVATHIQSFNRRLAENPPASLVLFDSDERAWENHFEHIIREDPFVMLNLYYYDELKISSEIGSIFREREGWPEQMPRWVIFDSGGKIVVDGDAPPTAAQLSEACARANIIGRIESYRRFLRDHPGHEEARDVMLKEMVSVAEFRTRHALQIAEYIMPHSEILINRQTGVTSDGGEPSTEQIKLFSGLDYEADERIWRDYCTELQKHLDGKLWQLGGIPSDAYNITYTRKRISPTIFSQWAVFSPMTKELYSRMASKIENALLLQPSSTVLWGYWVTLQKTGVGKAMKELLKYLEPSPNVTQNNWPPMSVLVPYIESCRGNGDWRIIQDLVEPIWESKIRSITAYSAAVEGNVINLEGQFSYLSIFTYTFWTDIIEAYVEALLTQNRLSDAERVMSQWTEGDGWQGAFFVAADIAERLGYESIAKAWREEAEREW